MQRFTGRQLSVIIVAVCSAIIATPVVALAVTATFSSTSASTPAVSAKNSSSGSGAKAVYGNAAASGGTVYGVYGHTNSAHGYGVYSAGRLGSAGELVCAQCVTGADVNAATLPTVPDASKLGGHNPSYYARIVPDYRVLPNDGQTQSLANVDGFVVLAYCNTGFEHLEVQAATTASNGTVNYFWISNATAHASGAGLSTTPFEIANSAGGQTEGTAVYTNDTTHQVITFNFHLYGSLCQVFGNLVTAG